MVEQAAKPLAQSVRILIVFAPLQVWSLDASPGKVRVGGDGEDHPAELISFIRKLPKEVYSKQDTVNALIQEGFSMDVAQVYSELSMLIHDTPIVVRLLHKKCYCCYCNLCENLNSH
ncbi:hypothetical protein DKX38_022616 [Salix brachista]|uniref:Uncharacterized protein n=1 Tax=Salix brachista TaxID=2182728 RepID=A0A5N5KBJ3_9ROSI|nr:hypothetical protein DKX38_022616 [Salix brachista]